MSDAQSQRNENFKSDLRWMWEEYVRNFISSDRYDQELLEDLDLFVHINGTCF